jgi:hypothetical protein
MIDLSHLRSLSADLEAFRSAESRLVKYDDRISTNYSSRGVSQIWDKLEKHDPTGFASAMLLDEMIENVLHQSDVSLHRVLREPGYVKSLEKIMAIKNHLIRQLETPRQNFIDRITASLVTVTGNDQPPSTREVAACMRDAIYAIDGGLKLRWMRCTTEAFDDMPLCPDVRHYDTIPEFIESLMSELPYGAHLACVAGRLTVIGLKQPGRVAYLSTISIDNHTGRFQQSRADQYNTSEFDLTKPKERYPDWGTPAHEAGAVTIEGQKGFIHHLKQLKRDQVLWLALLVEMTKQTMARTDPSTIALTETMTNALAGANKEMLPALRVNYVMNTKSIDEIVSELELNDWTRNFVRPALDGLTIDHMLPICDSPVVISIETREHSRTRSQTELYGYPGGHTNYYSTHVSLHTISPSLAGTQAEVEGVRNWVLGHNVVAYLMTYLNTTIAKTFVTETFPWFKKRVQKNLRAALKSGCVTFSVFDRIPDNGIYFYSQSDKHRNYNPRCYFDDILTPTHLATIDAQNSADIVEMLGLKSEKDLPEYLRGWSRTADDAVGAKMPFGFRKFWAWNNLNAGSHNLYVDNNKIKDEPVNNTAFFRVSVALNKRSVPELNIDRIEAEQAAQAEAQRQAQKLRLEGIGDWYGSKTQKA